MMRSIKYLFATGLLVAFLFAAPSLYAADILDRLPEVEAAKAFNFVLFWHDELASLDNIDCSGISLEREELPSHLLIDENGENRTLWEMREVLIQINCVYSQILSGQFFEAPEHLPLFLEVLAGSVVEFPNEIIIDGTKQSVRASLMANFLVLLDFELRGWFEFGLLASDACTQFREWSATADSAELQWVAFFILFEQYRRTLSGDEFVTCTFSEGDGETEGQLIDLAKSGDVDAAVRLAHIWRSGIDAAFEEFIEGPRTKEAFEIFSEEMTRRQQQFELIILRNTMRYPVLVAAASKIVSSIHLLLGARID
jgi:hypothetical protein